MKGDLALAEALKDLSSVFYTTQDITQCITANTATNYLGTVTADTAKVTADQEECVTYATAATVGNTKDAIEAAKWNAQVSIDSTQMNQDMGRANTAVNTENNEQEVQATNLTPVFAGENYLALVFLNTSSTIISYQG
jgi:transcription initiation factor IIF auxiliary subunit